MRGGWCVSSSGNGDKKDETCSRQQCTAVISLNEKLLFFVGENTQLMLVTTQKHCVVTDYLLYEAA